MHSASFESFKYIHETQYEQDDEYALEHKYKTLDMIAGKMIVYAHGEGYRVYGSCDKFMNHLSTMGAHERVFHEVIFDLPQKLKFDIDAALDKLDAFHMVAPEPIIVDDVINDPYIIELLAGLPEVDVVAPQPAIDTTESKYNHILSTILQAIRDTFFITYEQSLTPADEVICVSRADGESVSSMPVAKYSNHIIINNYYVTDHLQAHEFTRLVLAALPPQYRPFIDASVNKSIQNFRIVGCHKTNDNRTKRVCSDHSEHDTLIRYISKCKQLPSIITAPVKPTQGPAPGLHPDDLAAIIELCYSDVHIKMAHKFQCVKGQLLIFYRTRSSDCEFCDRVHTTDNTLIVSTRIEDGTISVFKHCRKYKAEHGSKAIKLGEVSSSILWADCPGTDSTVVGGDSGAPQTTTAKGDRATCYVDRQVRRSLTTSAYACGPRRTLFDDLPAAQINRYSAPSLAPFELVPTLVVKAAMKMGKTKALATHLATHFADGLRKQVIRFISFRQTFSSNIKEKFPDFALYSDTSGTLDDHRLIVQVESLYRLDIRAGMPPPDLLILDECESIFEQFGSGLLRGNLNECFSKMRYLLRYSKHVICMDANVGDRTFRLLTRIRSDGAPITYHHNTHRNATEDVYYIGGDRMKWLGMLYAAVAKGDKVSIPTSSLTEAKTLFRGLSERFPEKTIKMYSSDTATSEKKAHFTDVNTHWAQFDILIYTPTVSAGVSFEKVHFDKIFGYFVDISCPVETCQQMIGRVRNVGHHQFIICLAATGNCLSTTIEDIQEDIYRRRENLAKDFDDTGLRTEYGPNGDLVYHATDYFYLWLENTRVRNLSRNSFASRFTQMVVDTGATAHLLDARVYLEATGKPAVDDFGDPAKHLIALWETHYQLRKEIRADFCAAVSQARDMSPEEIEEVQDTIIAQKDITPAQRYSFERHRLRIDYNYEGVIDATFVDEYHNSKVRRIYKNLTRLVSYNTTEAAWRGIQIEERVIHNYLMSLGDFSQYQDLNRKYVTDQHRYALSLLRLCGWSHVDDVALIHMNTLKYSIETSQYWGSIAAACKEFEIMPPKKQYADALCDDPSGWLKCVLKPVNKILMIMYGVLIEPCKEPPYVYKLRRKVFFAKTREASLAERKPLITKPQ